MASSGPPKCGRFTADPHSPSACRVPAFLEDSVGRASYGYFFPWGMSTLREGEAVSVQQDFYPMDAALVDLIGATAKGLDLVNAHGEPARVITGGVGSSGMAFNDDATLARWIHAISDVVGNENPDEFDQFKAVAERNAGRLLNAVLAGGEL